MITTITTSSITSITSVTSTITTTTTAVIGFMVLTLGIVAVAALVILLCTKELAAVSAGQSNRILAKFLDVGIVPLAITFALIVIARVIEII